MDPGPRSVLTDLGPIFLDPLDPGPCKIDGSEFGSKNHPCPDPRIQEIRFNFQKLYYMQDHA